MFPGSAPLSQRIALETGKGLRWRVMCAETKIQSGFFFFFSALKEARINFLPGSDLSGRVAVKGLSCEEPPASSDQRSRIISWKQLVFLLIQRPCRVKAG